MISRRITLCLALVAIIVSSLVRTSECSRYHSDDGNKSPRHRHRHRHDSTSVASSRRNHESLSSARRSPWPQQDDDYEDAQDVDEDDDEEDEDYDIEPRTRTLYERNYQATRGAPRNHHSRFEPRYPLRYHPAGHHPGPWYRGAAEEDADRRRNSRYGGAVGGRGHRQRPGRDRTQERRRGEAAAPVGAYARNHEFEDPEEDPEDEVELDHDVGGYDRSVRRWRFEEDSDEGSQDYRGVNSGGPRWRNSRRYRPHDHYDVTAESKGHRGRQEPRRNDWKSWAANSPASSGGSAGQRAEDDDWTDRRRKTAASHRKRPGRVMPVEDPDYEDVEEGRNESRGSWSNKKSRNNLVDHGFNGGTDRRKENDLDDRDFDYDVAESGDARRADKRREDEEDEEEENIWKEDEENEDDDDDQDFDNTNYYKSEDEPPYKTFDDIIKSLTSEDPTTPKSTIRREYRNTGIEKYLRRDAYGNMYDSRNVTVIAKPAHDVFNVGRTSNWTNNAASSRWRLHPSKSDVASYPNARDGKKLSNSIGDTREHERKRIRAKLEDPQPRTKSLEQEYDEDYDNSEKDEDAVKVAGERANEMQADVTTEYADEENETETEGETSAPLATSSTTTSTTTTTTTTTTPRPVVTTAPARVTQERRDSRSYDSSTAPQSNALQQTTHGSHKWQSLATRDGDKDSKGRAQQNEKNGKADIKEAIQHAIKVSREGSCQWPRARVIPVRDVYPSPSTTYVPHCAILHRCSDDTGCCRSEALTCVPKISHRVELYFYTNNIGGGSVVEKLSFYNHTECECKERIEYGAPSDKTSVTNEPKHHPTAVSPPQNIRRPPQRKPCKCPSEFTPRIVEGVCQCNCYENDDNCIRIRRGKGYFSFRDRLCIQNDQCATPMCEFGDYMRRQGKCPRKRDKFNAIATSLNLHHRIRS